MLKLTLIVTPVGSRCPLSCDYCYNKDSHLRRVIPTETMSENVLEEMLRKFMSFSQRNYEIIWHGGEPTLAGIEFFETVVRIQDRLRGELSTKGKIINNIQTNGVLINDNWAKFLKEKNFRVGISIDGTEYVHDRHRRYPTGSGSHADVMAGLRLLKAHGNKVGAGAVVTRSTLEDPIGVFKFLNANFTAFDFSPCYSTTASDGSVTQEITPKQYADFVKLTFDYWFKLDNPKIYIKSFRNYIAATLGHRPNSCSMNNGCHRFLSVDNNGEVYPCGRLNGVQKLKFGSIKETTFEEILRQDKYRQYQEIAHSLSRECTSCKWVRACNNGCPASRYKEDGDFLAKSPFCESTIEILEHVSHVVKRV